MPNNLTTQRNVIGVVLNVRKFAPGSRLFFLLSLGTVIPAAVAGIAPIRPDFDTGSLALVANRAVMFYTRGLLCSVHGD
jgi:hypothetical protein